MRPEQDALSAEGLHLKAGRDAAGTFSGYPALARYPDDALQHAVVVGIIISNVITEVNILFDEQEVALNLFEQLSGRFHLHEQLC